MRIWCRYSGIEFTTGDFKNIKANGEHPLMLVPTRTLIARAGEWAKGALTEEETIILFVALLKSTDLVEFRTSAAADYATCQKYMEFTLRTIGWKEALGDEILKLPKFIINHSTRDLKNVHHWLATWEDIKEGWRNNYNRAQRAKHILDKLASREEALARLIKSYTKKSSDYAWMLAKWAMEAADVPKQLREYWTDLFKLKGQAIYLARLVDLEEMVEHMEDNLPHGTIYAHATMKHIRDILTKNRAGDFGLGISGTDSLGNTIQSPFRIIEDDIELQNKMRLMQDAPTEEPKRSDYSSLVEYLKAKASWTLLQSHVNRLAELEEKAQAEDSASILDTVDTEGDTSEEEVSELLDKTHQGLMFRADYKE